MNKRKIAEWLAARGMTMEQNFASTLREFSRVYLKNHKTSSLDAVYELLGTRKQYLAYWKDHPVSTQTKKL